MGSDIMLVESSCTVSYSERSVLAAALFALALFTAPAMAQEVESFVDCAGTYNAGLNCTSNDIKINEVAQMTELQGGQAPITTCNEDDPGVIDIALTTQLNANARYDVLTWFGTEGNDPRAATADNCHVSSLPDDPASAFILDIDGDACLDVNSSPDPVTQYMFQVPFTCTDTWSLDVNGDPQQTPDGETDVFALVTWFQNNTLICGTGAGQSLEPGLNPKCDISLLLGLNIEIITNPAIEIVKTPATQEVVPGATANFTLTVTNLGDVDLDTVVVTDPLCDAAPVFDTVDDGNDGLLSPAEDWVYTCSTSNVQAGFTNTADVTAEEVDTANEVNDTDTATVTVAAPGIQIVKTPATQQVNPGGTAAFTLTVTNSGDTDLDTVVVSDPECDAAPTLDSGDTGSDGVLPGDGSETWVYSCSTANVQAGFTNNASVTAVPVGGGDAVNDSDTATVTVSAPAVMIVKSPDQNVLSGGTADFTLTVTNPGDVDLTSVSVTDPLCDANPVLQSGDIGVDGVLTTTETWTYTCSTANVQADFTNTANVTATPVGGGDSVNDSDTANVFIVAPPAEDVPIPTLGQWLLVFLAAVLLVSGLLARRGVLGRK
jgi:uncharacterized repeat protein (TIGR01451 family)